jgi:hypothetical protein
MTIDARFGRACFHARSIADGERLARELAPLLEARFVGCAVLDAEIAAIVDDLRSLGFPLSLESGSFEDNVMHVYGDDPAGGHELALLLHGDFDSKGGARRVDRVEVLWQRS